MANMTLSVITNCRGPRKSRLYRGLVELNDMVINKSVIIFFVDYNVSDIVRGACEHDFMGSLKSF